MSSVKKIWGFPCGSDDKASVCFAETGVRSWGREEGVMTATTLSLLFPLRDESLDFLSLNKRWPWGLVYNNQQNMAKVMVWSVQAQALKRRLTTSFSFWENLASNNWVTCPIVQQLVEGLAQASSVLSCIRIIDNSQLLSFFFKA